MLSLLISNSYGGTAKTMQFFLPFNCNLSISSVKMKILRWVADLIVISRIFFTPSLNAVLRSSCIFNWRTQVPAIVLPSAWNKAKVNRIVNRHAMDGQLALKQLRSLQTINRKPCVVNYDHRWIDMLFVNKNELHEYRNCLLTHFETPSANYA